MIAFHYKMNNDNNDLSKAQIKRMLHTKKAELQSLGIFSALSGFFGTNKSDNRKDSNNLLESNAKKDDCANAERSNNTKLSATLDDDSSYNTKDCNDNDAEQDDSISTSNNDDKEIDDNSTVHDYTSSDDDRPPVTTVGSVVSNTTSALTSRSQTSGTHRRHCFWFTVSQKIEIVQEYVFANKLCQTAKKYKIDPGALSRWKKTINQLHETAMRNPNAKSCNKGKVCSTEAIEKTIWEWVQDNIKKDVITTTNHIIMKAVMIDPNFKGKRQTAIKRWVYSFMGRWRLSVRRITHLGQKLSGHLQVIRDDFTNGVNLRFVNGGSLSYVKPSMFLNMDQTCVYFESKHSTTVTNKGKKTYTTDLF